MGETAAERIAGELRENLGGRIVDITVPSPKRVYLSVAPKDVPEVAWYLWNDRKARFNIASGVQLRVGFEVLYHFALNEGDERGTGNRDGVEVSVRVRIEQSENPSLPSVAGRIKAFNFIERELHDLLGITFDGHPGLEPLLRAEDWPDDFYPLRRTEKRAELDYEGADRQK